MKIFLLLLIIFKFLIIQTADDCTDWNHDYYCDTLEITDNAFSEEMDENAFQTPPRNDIYGNYQSSFQDMHYLVGYIHQVYSSNKKTCTVTFNTKVNPLLGTKGVDYKILYKFGEEEKEENTIVVNSETHSYPNGMPVSARIIDLNTETEIVKLELEDEYFIWDNSEINLPEEYEKGQKGAIVEFFGWPYEDLTEECEFLSNAGYLGLKVYWPNEHLSTEETLESGQINPWWYGTQTVSYKLHSRMGDKKQLKKMIDKCRSLNVRVYAEVVVNHMTGDGKDMYKYHRLDKGVTCEVWGQISGSDGSPFWSIGNLYYNNPYTNKKPVIEYPAVPYFPSDFHCRKDIEKWDDIDELTNGWMFSLADVNTEKNYVRERIADFFTELISIGISGISIANGRHIITQSFAEILYKLKSNLGGIFPDDLLIVIILENINMDLAMCDKGSQLNFGKPFTQLLQGKGFTNDDIYKIKIWLKGFIDGEEKFPICDDEWQILQERHVISLEYSDDINMAELYNIYIRDKNIEEHRENTISMFENEYETEESSWKIKYIFTSFSLYNNVGGIPDGKSDCNYCKTEECKNNCDKPFPYRKAYNPLSTGYDTGDMDNWIEGEYTRIHRDQLIINAMRKWMFPEKPEMTEEQIYNNERIKTNCDEKCLTCNEESKKDNLCVICNYNKGYYPVIYPGTEQNFYECYKSSLKYDRLYFDEKKRAFKPCYESCKKCEKEGDTENHNCLSCDYNLIQKPGSEGSTYNCVTECVYSFYFSESGQYKCTEIALCPPQASLLIKEKNKCIDNCQNDAEYKYLYNGNCIKQCPDNTINEDFVCKDKNNNNECLLSAKDLLLDNFYNDIIVNSLVKSYKEEYIYTNKHILKIINQGYNIYIYKDANCITKLGLGIINIDPEDCIDKIKTENNIDEDLIIVYFETTRIKISGYLLYNPITGQKLDYESICTNSNKKYIDDFIYIYLDSGKESEVKSCPEGLYPVVYLGQSIDYKNCKNSSLSYDNIYFDLSQQMFLPCYELCKHCTKEGNSENNFCTACEKGYIPYPKSSTQVFNCVHKCEYSYYFTKLDLYKCTATPQCPLDFNKYIEDKNQCVEDCKDDETYKYLYNGICFKSCPEGTQDEDGDYICRQITENGADIYTLSKKDGALANFNDDGGIDSLVKSYKDEFSYTNKHISEINNKDYNILIYKEQNSFDELGLKFPEINFGICYNKVKNAYNIDEDLIVVLLERLHLKSSSTSSYSLYNPKTGVKLNAQEICKDDEIIIKENVFKILGDYEKNYDDIIFLTNQNIDVFNSSDAFYTDICFPFESPNNRDITLEDRLKSFYPNVSLCDKGCYYKGVNLTSMDAICSCKFNDISNNKVFEEISDIGGFNEAIEVIRTSNIEVFKCFKYLFKKFKTSIGGYLIICSIAICITFGLVFYLRDYNKIKKYIISKTTSYINYLSNLSDAEDKKNKKIESDLSNKKIVIVDIKNEKNDSLMKNQIKQNNKINSNDIKNNNTEQSKEILFLNKINNSKNILSHSFKENNSKNQINELDANKVDDKSDKEKDSKKEEEEKEEDFKQYLERDIDDQEFEDIRLKDKRSFQEYFWDSLTEKNIFVNTFINDNSFRPLSIKIVLLDLNLIMYIVVNALFYGENVISEIYHLEGEDSFLGFFPRSIRRYFYSAVVGVILGIIIDCFFIEEKTMKGIFNREKENVLNLKTEITKLNKKIKDRYIKFIIFVIILLLLFGFYLLCFNYVYPNTQIEWIKSSIMLIIIIQILSVIIALAETLFRFLSFMFRSEKIFRVSKLLN